MTESNQSEPEASFVYEPSGILAYEIDLKLLMCGGNNGTAPSIKLKSRYNCHCVGIMYCYPKQ